MRIMYIRAIISYCRQIIIKLSRCFIFARCQSKSRKEEMFRLIIFVMTKTMSVLIICGIVKFDDDQFAARRNSGVATLIVVSNHMLEWSGHEPSPLCVVLLNCSNAFDSIRHSFPIEQLLYVQIPNNISLHHWILIFHNRIIAPNFWVSQFIFLLMKCVTNSSELGPIDFVFFVISGLKPINKCNLNSDDCYMYLAAPASSITITEMEL